MKKILQLSFAALSCIFLLSACSPRLSPFTQSLYEENNWGERELKRIQFYLSESVTLRRQKTDADSRIEGGKIRSEQGRQIEEIIIPKGTPGLLTYLPREDRFAISFEENAKNRTLTFGPDSRNGNRYILKVAKWNKNKGLVVYDDQNFYVSRNDAPAVLLVDLKKIRKTQVKKRVAKGNEL